MKKWTYLVAAGMMLGAAPVFTGCIDNDEPEGITILRGAKAELLKAKATVELAKAEQAKAEAALKLAEAEVQKAEAARIQAIADYEAARAKEMEYKAELANIQNEEERAKLENQIKIYAEERAAAERAAKEAAAQLEVTLMTLKANLAQQEALYEQALKDLALAKNTLTDAQQAHLTKWTTALENAQAAVSEKAEAYEKAVRRLAKQTAIMEKTEAKESYLREEKKAVEDAKIALDAAIEARDLAKEYAEKDFAEIEKWEAERVTLEAEIDALNKKLADLDVERTKLEMATEEEWKAVEEARKAYQDLTGNVWNESTKEFDLALSSTEPIKLNDIVLAIDEPNIITVDKTLTEEYLYSSYLYALQNGQVFQDGLYQVQEIKQLKNDINNAILTPNNEAWTEERVASYKRYLEELQEETDSQKALWEQAVKAYKGLEYGNPTSFDGFDKVEEAVAAYNEAVKKFNADDVAYRTFMAEKLQPVSDEFNDKMAEIDATYRKATEDNWAEYEKTRTDIENNIGALEKAMNVAWANYDKLKTEYDQIENPKEGDDKAYKAALEVYEKAEAAVTKARKEAYGYWEETTEGFIPVPGSLEKAQTIRDNKNEIAEKDKALAEAKAIEAYFKANPNNALENEAQKLSDAIYGENGSYVASRNAYDAVCDALSTFNRQFGFDTSYDVINEAYFYFNEEGVYTPQEVKAEDAARIDKYSLEQRIYQFSRRLYGYDNYNRLVELTVAEINQEIEKKYASTYPDATFVPKYYYINNYRYGGYGLVGQIEYYKAWIAQGTAALQPEMKTKVANLIKEMDAHLADIDAQIAAYTAEVVEPAEEAFTTAYNKVMDQFAEVDGAIEEAKAQKFAKKPVLDRIVSAIEVYVNQETDANGNSINANTLENLKETLQNAYEQAVANAYNKETEYIDAKEDLQAVIDDTKEPVELAQAKVARAQKALEDAQAELKAASEALQAEIERISATDAE